MRPIAARLAVPPLVLAALCSAALAGCAGHPSPVPVAAPETDLTVLAGEWRGEYSSPETGRSGSIEFTLEAGRDTAFGDVLMLPPPSGEAYLPMRRGEVPGREPPRASVLRIRFVQAANGTVRGALEPYEAPDCRCTVHTVFVGLVAGDSISGEYRTDGMPDGRVRWGRWAVARHPGGAH